MANSYLNIVTFLLTTLLYYLIKPTPENPDILAPSNINSPEYKSYTKSHYLYLGIYVVLVILVQFIVNASVISNKCGGSITDNIGAAGLLTFFPWILIFGVIIAILLVYPGFKSAFSDVIGYFFVSTQANRTLTELLMLDKDVENQINSLSTSENEKKSLQESANVILKICGNSSILINQIVPQNFNEYWNILTPLMKPQFRNNSSPETLKLKKELFDVATTRDNIGEALWYIYTGVLITSLVQLKIASRPCSRTNETMKKNYEKYVKTQEEVAAKKKSTESQIYTITD
jgi:hypothetical protein